MRGNGWTAAAALLVGAGLLAMGQQARAAGLKCTGPDGKSACTAQQVADLNQGILVGRRMHQPLAMVKGVSLGRNGSLMCTQMNGSACTEDQLSAVMALAPSTHSSGGTIHIVREVDRASP
jgi:hypothetical protein